MCIRDSSFGVSRLLAYIFHYEMLTEQAPGLATVMVAVADEDQRTQCNQVAASLRDRGVATLVSDATTAFGKQIKRAEKLGCSYVWFITEDGHEVRDMAQRSQVEADPASWVPAGE